MGFWEYLEYINSFCVDLTQIYSSEISLAFVATCLVLLGDNMNAFVRRRVMKYFFLIRIFVFILLCAVGYGLMTVIIQPLVQDLLLKVPKEYSFLFCTFCFILLGIFAEKKELYNS